MRVFASQNKTAVSKGKNELKIKTVHRDAGLLTHYQQQQPQMIQENTLVSINLKNSNIEPKDTTCAGFPANSTVPIYSITNMTASFQASRPKQNKDKEKENPDAYFARGTLLGKFYEKEGNIEADVIFVGSFKGSIEYQPEEGILYFEGNITKLIIFHGNQNKEQVDKTISQIANEETSFRGFFKGNLYRWADAKQIIKDLDYTNDGIHEIANKIEKVKNIKLSQYTPTLYRMNNDFHFQKDEKKKKDLAYYVPSVMRFEVQDVRQINLQKSMAVVSGYLHLQFKYNEEILKMMLLTLKLKKTAKKDYDSFLNLVIQFNRDFSLNMPLQQALQEIASNYEEGNETNNKDKNKEDYDDEDDDSENSSSSEWSIQDKTWDIQYQIDQKRQVIKFQIWKMFNSEIDYSYGSFFAPFSLSVLRIVVTVNSFQVVSQQGGKVKINLSGCDIVDSVQQSKDKYDPFKGINDLSDDFYNHRLHKINRLKCSDSGIYIIADNRLSVYPHFKNTLINKNTSNDNSSWGLGIFDKKSLLEVPQVHKISENYVQFEKKRQTQKYMPFAFQKWNYFSIQIPIYKYIAIEMIQIFVPLILLSIISLFIFQQSNGISDSSGFSTLALRIVNVCSLMIAYVSLIPTLRQNLPPMPTVTFIEIITYIQTLPNLLALVNSMAFYEVSMTAWQSTYKVFQDSIFLICFIISTLNLFILMIVFVVYASRQYNAKIPKVHEEVGQKKVQYYSPQYVHFMDQMIECRHEYKIEKVK